MTDVDVDFDSERRPEVKAYLERRYNHNGKLRVFSAGTFTTEKIRSVIKDVCRVHKIPIGTVNYITKIIEDSSDWTDVMKLAYENKKVYDFVQKNWEVFEEIRPIMYQPRSAGVHASALIITPDIINGKDVECFDLLPIRKQNDMLVSEIDGYSIDDIGLLKNDVLAIAELSRIAEMMEACNEVYDANVSIPHILNSDLNDPSVYSLICKGLTQGIFQMSGPGMTRFMKDMRPSNIKDLIASIALFRPGALKTGSAQGYCDAKNGLIEPEYLWGTYDALKDTYGFIVYQEQVSQIARSVGNLSLGDGVKLVKALSKKKIEKVRVFKDKFFDGAKKNGCPIDAANKIWSDVEEASKYLFNLSHATAYGLTGFVGAWIKAKFPIVFYTVMLKWAKDENLPILLNEIRRIPGVSIVSPDINVSTDSFVTDYSINKIYWSLIRVAQCGPKAVNYILLERKTFGKYKNLEDFVKRMFPNKLKINEVERNEEKKNDDIVALSEKNPVTTRILLNLIKAGAFDTLEDVKSPVERYGLLKKVEELLDGVEPLKDISDELVSKAYYWSQIQIKLSGMGSVDYRQIYFSIERPKSLDRYEFVDFINLEDMSFTTKKTAVTCFRVMEVIEKRYKDQRDGTSKKAGKIKGQQNTDMTEIMLWNDSWEENKRLFSPGAIIVAVVMVKYSEYDKKCVLQINRGAFVKSV